MNMYTPDMVGSGQFGVCEKCGLMPTKEGHDGCLGTLNDSIVMNACCGHGDDSQAYIQYWDSACIRGNTAIDEIKRLKVIMLTKSRCSSKTGWWLNIDGRPMAKFVRESDIDYIIELQDKANKDD